MDGLSAPHWAIDGPDRSRHGSVKLTVRPASKAANGLRSYFELHLDIDGKRRRGQQRGSPHHPSKKIDVPHGVSLELF
jgi:hypothetical protein